MERTDAIRTKQSMYRHIRRGRFGNYPRSWGSLRELLESGFRGEVSVRSKEVGNPVRLYHVPVADVSLRVAGRQDLLFSEALPEHRNTIQGEWDGFHLRYTFAKAPMRIAFDEQNLHADGPRARLILLSHLQAGDYEWLCQLVDDYPNHTIEFSAFSVPVGVLGRHMLIWEVRTY